MGQGRRRIRWEHAGRRGVSAPRRVRRRHGLLALSTSPVAARSRAPCRPKAGTPRAYIHLRAVQFSVPVHVRRGSDAAEHESVARAPWAELACAVQAHLSRRDVVS